jgi:NAD(P)-dependent dehydrogenase (short-subunit alcohol dehydrogenase family)
VIWGASGGIGAALVTALHQAGWRVLAVARDTGRVPAQASFVCSFDAANPASYKEASTLLAHETQGAELVVYAAGDLRAELLKKMSAADWDAVLASNLTGAFLAASHSLYLLNEGGLMAFIGAYVDHVMLPKMGAYAAAKAGLETLVAVLRKENRRQRFAMVRPGAVNTALWQNAPFKLPADAKSPEAVAQAILTHYQSGINDDLNL